MRIYSWPLSVRAAVFLSVNFDAESLDLQSTTEERLYGRFSYGRYGVRAGFPRLVDLLRRHGIAATFFVSARDAQRHQTLLRQLIDEGHEIGARSMNLEDLSQLGNGELENLRQSSDLLSDSCGQRPLGFRAPGNILSVHTLHHLAELGFDYDSSFQDDDFPYQFELGPKSTLVEIPNTSALDDSVLYVARHPHARVMQSWREEFDAMYEAGTLVPLTLHLRGDIGSTRAARIAALDELISYMKSKPGIRFMNGRQLVEHTRSLGLDSEPDPALAHLPTLRTQPYRG